jgi:signal transduction histidine kinase/ligand-binding sensor domain-containing protein/AraC-like DNA-binding protein
MFRFLLCVLFSSTVFAEIRFNSLVLNHELNNLHIQSIIQSKEGLLLFGTDSGLMQYNGYQLTPFVAAQENSPGSKIKSIKVLYLDDQGLIWFGSRGQGLFYIKSGRIEKYRFDGIQTKAEYITDITADHQHNMWIATSKGIIKLANKQKHSLITIDENDRDTNYITSLLSINNRTMLVGTKNGLYEYKLLTDKFIKINLPGLDEKKYKIIYTLHQDANNNIWVGTQNGLYLNSSKQAGFVQFMHEMMKSKVISIESTQKHMWFGTVNNGLYAYSIKQQSISNFKNNTSSQSISDNTILSLFKDKSNVLWLSTFNKSVDFINLNSLDFGLEYSTSSSVDCAKSKSYRKIIVDQNKMIWLVNDTGIIKYSQNSCEYYEIGIEGVNIISMLIDSSKKVWITTNHGLYQFDQSSKKFKAIKLGLRDPFINYITELSEDMYLLSTWEGVYKYNSKQDQLVQIQADLFTDKDKLFTVSGSAKTQQGVLYLATNLGLLKYQDETLITLLSHLSVKEKAAFTSVVLDQKENLWVGTRSKGMLVFNNQGQLIDVVNKFPKNTDINSMLLGNDNKIWMGTNNGLSTYDLTSKNIHSYYYTDGLQDNYYNINSACMAPDGKLYFAGRNGFNAFYPKDIKLNNTPPQIVLTDFTRFGQSVIIGAEKDGFYLQKNINQLEELTLGHRDYVIGFEFAALDFADPLRNKYAYKMEGLDPEWIYTDASNRRISYSNLAAGEYTFTVKGANKDGIWNQTGKSIKLIIKPAPWLSWWAYSIYLLLFFSVLSWLLNKKNKATQKLTHMLRVEVAKQTKELKQQKQKIENLLSRKNALFANVSHEFRTPLTLILGSVNKLLSSPSPRANIDAIKMINRNANRLLTMIEQLLQIAKVAGNDNIQYHPIKTAPPINAIVESFKPLAQEKRIDLQLTNNDKSVIKISKDALEIVLGNLLSNAIKYTPIGGQIRVSSSVKDKDIIIEVADTGCGLDQQQQKDIFNRFKRLDSHQNIEGIGIGLSVVEDILKVNSASINIKSKPGQGSVFSITFSTIAMGFDESEIQVNSLLLRQLTSESNETVKAQQLKPQITNNKQHSSILIIDDNTDMRIHIADSLKGYYHCLLADGGKTGIALAIEHVPDIIICDVMMPEMDGFHVARVLRSDTRTSHIPLLLLTALDDRESRIRGWREHVDVYLTKPFDTQELLLQLETILVIRKILKDKNSKTIQAGKNTPLNIDLAKKDQEFLNKLNSHIASNYQDPFYTRTKLASDMAMSERQLQRKLKALIHKNPMELLREFRLTQAAIMLKDGYQVSIVSQECGFNYLPYFSKCFKSQFGLSPKVYQQTCKQVK